MKVVELMKISIETLKLMSRNGILVDDYQYAEPYERYQSMRRNGIKHKAAMLILCDELGVSERTLERAFKRLSREC